MASVEWGEYRIDDLFNIYTGRDVIIGKTSPGEIPLISHQNTENGVTRRIKHISNRRIFHYEETISLADRGVFYATTQNEDFHIGTRVKALVFKDGKKSENVRLFFSSAINKLQILFTDYSSNATDKLPKFKIQLPVLNGQIDYNFMESFIEELEAERIEELEAERIEELEAYLSVSGLKDTQLTADELSALDKFNSIKWKKFNLETLFGKSTRGKRLKGDDRIGGNLPFVTAGETDEGISAFISNDVEIFSSNTTTIDMFGSAKYRNYNYGADDHIAVVHTENLSKYAAIFVTSACHKSAYNGDFSYSRNFYAKDADKLYISLPVKNEQPDYELMSTLISAIQKLVIADVVKFSDEKIKATKQVVG